MEFFCEDRMDHLIWRPPLIECRLDEPYGYEDNGRRRTGENYPYRTAEVSDIFRICATNEKV